MDITSAIHTNTTIYDISAVHQPQTLTMRPVM